MNEEFDKELRDRISDVFDNYEGSSAEAGWALLREKYPAKDTKRPLPLWWYSAAAGLIIILGLAFWLYSGNTNKLPKIASVKKTIAAKPDSASNLKSLSGQTHSNPGKVVTHQTVNSVKRVVAKHTGREGSGNSIHTIRIKHSKFKSTTVASTIGQWTTDGTTQRPQQATTNTIADQTAAPINTAAQATVDTGKPATIPEPDTTAKSKKAIAQVAEKPKPISPGKVFSWGAFLSGYNTYATGSNNRFNSGGGLSADFALFGRFKLSTGLGVYQNSLNCTITSNVFYSIPSGASGSGSSQGIPVNTAKILSLELPVMLSFRVLKSGSYLSAGFSSAMFINERYENGTSSAALGSSAYSQQTVITYKHFSTFIFAKTFDISAGLAYPLGKNHIVLEPFVKMPLNSQGQAEFNYGSAGLNLKLTFGSGR